MPERFVFNLGELVRVCLNDPSARAEVLAALEGEPAPVRTPCATVEGGDDERWTVMLRTDRNKQPGEQGFLVRDEDGQFTARLKRAVASATPAAETMTAEQVAEQMGITTEELAERLKHSHSED